MAQMPKTIAGKLFAAVAIIAAVPVVAWIAITLSGPIVWISLVVTAVAAIVYFIWRRRDDAARERAWVGAFSFADVVKRRHEREALDLLDS